MAKTHKPTSLAEDAREQHAGPVKYTVIALVLFALAALSYVLARHVHLGAATVPVAMAIAVVKAALVVLFFMHLADHHGANRLVLGVSFVFVLLLMFFSIADVRTRFPAADPPGSEQAAPYIGTKGTGLGPESFQPQAPRGGE